MENTGFDTKELLGTVEGKIRSIAETLGPEIEYRFMNWAQANVELDKIEKPTVIYVLPPSGTLTFKWNEVKEAPTHRWRYKRGYEASGCPLCQGPQREWTL